MCRQFQRIFKKYIVIAAFTHEHFATNIIKIGTEIQKGARTYETRCITFIGPGIQEGWITKKTFIHIE